MIDEKKLIEDMLNNDGIDFRMDFNTDTEESVLESLREFVDKFRQGMIELVQKQPKVDEWIPFEVTEADEEDREAYGFEQMLRGKLPEEDEEILVTYSNGHVGEDVFLRDGYECYLDSGAEFVVDAVAWMSLPKPYKE